MVRALFLKSIFTISILLFYTIGLSATRYQVFSEGKSQYSIIIAAKASESEIYVAKELQTYLLKIGSVIIPIKHCGEGKKGSRILIGYSEDVKRLFPNLVKPDPEAEAFFYKNKGGDIIIVGGEMRGTMYGVFSFLERELGCRWFTRSCTIIPTRDEYSFERLDFSDAPAIPVRNILYSEIRNTDFRIHCRINEQINTVPAKPLSQKGGCYAFWGPHTLGSLLPVEEYYDAHPEYFALRNGRRLDGKTQPCFTNSDVLNVCIESIRKVMRECPEFDIYEVSTNDNHEHCECEKCKAAIKQLGSYTDVVLDFVNRVALAIEKDFPDKKIEFLAYQEVRHPPISVKPRHNVAVRLANIEICHVHGFEMCDSKTSREFCNELSKWRSITNELNIWEYASNFAAYNIPYPNFKAIQDNIRTYKREGVNGIFEEGDHYTYNGEFQALRIYVLSRLLWNPDIDLDSLVDDFIYGYYGPSAPYMRKYYDLIHSKISRTAHMTPFVAYNNIFFKGDLLSEAISIFKEAKSVAKDKEILRRVEIEELSVLLLHSLRNPKQAIKDGSFKQVQKVIEREQIELGRKDLRQRMKQIEKLATN